MQSTTQQTRDQYQPEGGIEAIWEWDLRTDSVYFSPGWKSMLGYAEEEVPGRFEEWEQRLHPEDHDRVMDVLRNYLAGKLQFCSFEHRLLHKDGSYSWCVTRAHLIRDMAGQPERLVGSHSGTTQRRRIREELDRFFTVSLDLFCIIDFNGWFRRLNPAWEKVTGWSLQEVMEKPYLEFVHPADRGPTLRAARKLAIGTEVVAFQNRYICKDGSHRWFSWNAVPVPEERLIYAAARDITSNKLTQEALLQSKAEANRLRFEARYAELVEHASYGIYRSTPEGKFLDVNPALVSLLGYAFKTELLAKNLDTDVFGTLEERDHVSGWFAHQDRLDGVEVRWKKKDGKPVTVRLSGRAVRDNRGVLESLELIVENVTARRELEERLYHSQKMEAIGRLTGGVAHDFNNLLNVIIGYSELLIDRLGPMDSRREEAEEIRRAGQRAASLTRQLLAFSRKQVLQPEVLDLNRVVTDTTSILARLLGEDIQLATHLDPSLCFVNVDRGQIEQVIVNLAVNARDAMPQGGRLVIETTAVQIGEGYLEHRPSMTPGRYAQLAVTDTGIGMDAETQRQIFEPFFTTKEKGKGTGLGLATVYGIVKQSGGFIWVYSELGQGSTFKVYFPAVSETPEPSQNDSRQPGSGGSSGTILLVEDDSSLRTLARKFLESSGYSILEAANGSEALRILEGAEGPVHLLLTDLVLPDMTGTTLSEQVVARSPQVKVLYVSGYTENVIVHRGVLDPGKSFLQKPYSKEVLLNRIRELLT